jgi:aldose 1-epimerase
MTMTLPQTVSVKVSGQSFGQTPEGIEVERYLISNETGMEVVVSTYGGILVSLKAPDRHGVLADVVLGFDTLAEYLASPKYFGVIAGRYANRIARGHFVLNGVPCFLEQNRGQNHLHGGFKGFDTVVWQAKEILRDDAAGIQFSYLSKDGEQGYPGNLQASVAYLLTESNELRLEYAATTDKTTIVNLTNHSYFNLAGSGNILAHELTIFADRFTPVDPTLIPTGELRAVSETPFDFTKPRLISEGIGTADEQLALAEGYDHNFVLQKPVGEWGPAATLHHPQSGRTLEIITTQPGLQFYSGNYIEGVHGKAGSVYKKHAGCCLETQHFPDSPNQPSFPTTVLTPDEQYSEATILRFSAA